MKYGKDEKIKDDAMGMKTTRDKKQDIRKRNKGEKTDWLGKKAGALDTFDHQRTDHRK